MGTTTVGRVLVSAKIENVIDLYAASRGQIRDDQVHRVEVDDALVDTGATLTWNDEAAHRTTRARPDWHPSSEDDHRRQQPSVSSDQLGLTIGGRSCSVDVSEVAGDCPVLIGYVPLELLDFVVSPEEQRLIGNPAHGGEFMIDMY